jgi:cytochrome P450
MNILDDPYPTYRSMRSHSPVCRDDKRRIWVLTRYEDVAAALKDPRLRSATRQTVSCGDTSILAQAAAHEITTLFTKQIEVCDPPVHTRLRFLLRSAFSKLDLRSVEQYAEGVARQLIDIMYEAGHGDIILDLACPLPYEVILHVLGIDPTARERFRYHVDRLLRLFASEFCNTQELEVGITSVRELAALVLSESTRTVRFSGLVHLLPHITYQGNRLELDELVANVILVFAAGHGTTANLIGNGVLALLRHPEQLEAMRQNPRLLRNAVEECLRYDSPVQSVGRIALADTDLGEHRLREGDTVSLIIGSANRDESAFPEPDSLVVNRRRNHHLAFGAGVHFCIGAQLARIQARIAIGALLRRCPSIRLEESCLSWHAGPTFRGLTTLPVRLR